MIASLILLCQLAGEAFVRGPGLPMPGPVIGHRDGPQRAREVAAGAAGRHRLAALKEF